MTAKQVQATRAAIDAALSRNDQAAADRLQAKLHQHFVAQADAFVNSKAGQKHMNSLMGRP